MLYANFLNSIILSVSSRENVFFPLHLCFLSTSSDSSECGCSSDIGFIVRTARSVPTRCGRTRACVSDSTTFQATCCHPPLSDFNALEVFLCPERVSHGSTVPALVWTEPTLRPFLAMTLPDVVCSLLLKGKKKISTEGLFCPFLGLRSWAFRIIQSFGLETRVASTQYHPEDKADP